MPATLADIDDALFAALARINPGAAAGTPGVTPGAARTTRNGAAVRLIGRWTGDPIRGSGLSDALRAAIQKEVDGRTPALLLGFDGENVEPRPYSVATLSGKVETVGLATWSVLCVARDARGTRVTMHGTAAGDAAALGVYDLQALVEEALNNLPIPGLHRVSSVRYLDVAQYLGNPGELYVLRARWQTRRVLADVRESGTDPTWTVPPGMLELSGDVNLYPPELAADIPTNPLGGFLAHPDAPPPRDLYVPPMRALLARFDAAYPNGADDSGAPRTPPSDGNRVPELRDRHAGRWTLAQPTPTAQPVYETEALGALPGVVLPIGTELAGSIVWVPVGAEPRTLVVVLSSAQAIGALSSIAAWGSTLWADSGAQFDLCLTRDGAGVSRFTLRFGGSQLALPTVTPADATGWALVASYDGATARLRAIPREGVGETGTAAVTLDTPAGSTFALNRGGLGQSTLLEALVYREAFNAGAEGDLLAYLAGRYAFTGT